MISGVIDAFHRTLSTARLGNTFECECVLVEDGEQIRPAHRGTRVKGQSIALVVNGLQGGTIAPPLTLRNLKKAGLCWQQLATSVPGNGQLSTRLVAPSAPLSFPPASISMSFNIRRTATSIALISSSNQSVSARNP